jgi:MOSC domain-containing protein YiiM
MSLIVTGDPMSERLLLSPPHIFQLNCSPGGVPKLPVMQAAVSEAGLEGDKQRNLRVHGGPNRALCLYSLENILALQAAGHPVHPGSMGENITLAGVDLAALGPGDVLELGDDVVIELTSYAHPCENIAGSFANGDIAQVSAKRHPGMSRIYARVLQGGMLRPGLPVRLAERPREE